MNTSARQRGAGSIGRRWWLLLALALPVPWLGLGGAMAQAQEPHAQPAGGVRSAQKARRTPALRNEIFEQLAAAQAAAEAGKIAEAERLLEALQRQYSGNNALNSYELANVHNFYAFIHYSQQRYPEAIAAYQKVLAQPDLPEPMEIGTRYSLAQLYLVIEDWSRAARMLESWFKVAPNPASDAWILLAQANYQLQQYDVALSNVERGMAEAKKRGQEPKEQWYLLMRVLYYAKGDVDRTTAILEILARRWPKKDYFVQLSGMYGEQKNQAGQLAALEVAYLAGWLQVERELLNLAYLYLGHDTPWKAAGVLEQGLEEKRIEATPKNLDLLGVALRQARENQRAIPYLERAATIAGDGEMWARLASIELDEDNNEKAADAARKALSMGGGKRPDNTRVVLGMALYNLGRLNEARSAFTEAKRDQRSERISEQWIRFLDTEIARAEQLAKEV